MAITKRELDEVCRRFREQRETEAAKEAACKRGDHPWHWHAGHQRETCPECGAFNPIVAIDY